ncbi:LmeA family phospholipid-binding protein [Georgenia wangjunii]|uniref:LmeA family phospholipid-binding protein n=1 Tax=Georgenia wangjunii TaxID=3117730 RepID=UPI002F2673DC
MRRLAAVVLVLALVVLAGGAVVDRLVHARTEEDLAAAIGEEVEVDGAMDVTIDGFPFLTQVLAGSLAEVRGTADGVLVEGLRLEDVRVAARGVDTSEPHVSDTVELNATVPLATLRAALEEAAPGSGLRLDLDGERVRLGIDVLGTAIAVGAEPVAAGAAVELELAEIAVGGRSVGADELPSVVSDLFAGLSLPVPGLPEGLALTRVDVIEGGVRVRAEGEDVSLIEVADRGSR